MAKEGKKPIGKIVLGVIVVLVIVGAVGSMGGNSTDSSASDSAKPAEATQQAEEQKNRKNRIPLLTRLKTPPVSLPIRSRARLPITRTRKRATFRLSMFCMMPMATRLERLLQTPII